MRFVTMTYRVIYSLFTVTSIHSTAAEKVNYEKNYETMWNVTRKIQDCTRLIQRNRDKEIEKEIDSRQIEHRSEK